MPITNYIKVRVSIGFITGSPDERFTGAFRDRLSITEEQIRSSIILQINEAIGLHNWAVHLTLPTQEEGSVDIWADGDEDYATILRIIKSLLKDYNITSFYNGTVSERLKAYI